VGWTCATCGSDALRALVVGARRTAEELGRAFPGTPVRTSGGDVVLASVPAEPALVVATPGAEPVAEAGYGAVLLLDGWALLARPDLRAGEEALRRWLAAAALARSGPSGGTVVVMAAGELRPVQALVRWRPDWHAERELAERVALQFPPAVRMASITGAPGPVVDLLRVTELPPTAEVLGPAPVCPPAGRPAGEAGGAGGGAGGAAAATERALVRVPREAGAALAVALHGAAAWRSAHKQRPVRIELDPLQLW